jgi:transcriptional regulator with XRE-family HTH domain
MNQKTTNNLSIGQKVGKYVSYQRKKRDWSLQELADKSSLTASFLHRLEKGEYQSIKFDVFEKIACAFKIPLADFLAKCQITAQFSELPPLDYFLKEKYQLPQQAIEDMKLFLELLQKKYAQQIKELKKQHQAYWGKE